MKGRVFKGYMLGVIGSACYGLNPLFALPLYQKGLTPDSVLFYRYFFARVTTIWMPALPPLFFSYTLSWWQ